jgi:hypothetical protein
MAAQGYLKERPLSWEKTLGKMTPLDIKSIYKGKHLLKEDGHLLFFLAVLGFELRASPLLGSHLSHSASPGYIS